MRIFWSSFAALMLAACATTGGGNGGSGGVSEVHLFGLPVAVNFDSKPGPDGFAVRVYVTRGADAKGSTLRNGLLEIMMFDGIVGPGDILARQPGQSWKFTPAQLPRLEEQTSLGHGYRFALRWTNPPKHGSITVLARYIPVKGEPVYSSPSTISSTIK